MPATVQRYTIADVRAANKAAGFFFFERASMRFFASRIESGTYNGPGGVYFLTSEQYRGSQGSGPRCFTVRTFDAATGDVDTLGKFMAHDWKDDARDAARSAAAGKGPTDAYDITETVDGRFMVLRNGFQIGGPLAAGGVCGTAEYTTRAAAVLAAWKDGASNG